MTIPEEAFNTNMEFLYEETVFEIVIDGKDYQIYSQAVPSEKITGMDAKYYLFFLIETENSYASDQIASVKQAFTGILLGVLMIVLTGFMVVLAIIIFIALRTSWRITTAIDVMTRYTQKLKKAPNVDAKIEIIDEISGDPHFVKISEKFENMKKAKTALIKRHKATDPFYKTAV